MSSSRKELKKIRKKVKNKFNRYINGTKGVISLFLALLMVPFTTIAGCLINAARVNSAVAIFDEALCNASNSTLGTYDEFLRKRFGFLAVSQNLSSKGEGYTVQDLISETFEYYMEENVGALSKTYTDVEVSASGVYPLADTDVLLSQVLESGKYSVPTEMVIDGLSLDDILLTFTSSLSLAKQICDTVTSGTVMVDKLDDCDKKFEALREKIKLSTEAETEYTKAYNEFVASVSDYNSLIDELSKKISEKQAAIDAAQQQVNDSQKNYTDQEKEVSRITKQIEAMKNDSSVDSKAIKEVEKTNKDTLEAFDDAKDSLEASKDALSSAKADLQTLIDSYSQKLSEKRQIVSDKKIAYINKIDAFANAVKDVGNALISAQSSAKTLKSSSYNLIKNISSTIYESQQQEIGKQIDDMKKNKEEADKRGDSEASASWKKQIDEAKDNQTEIKNDNKLSKALYDAESKGISSLQAFINEDYRGIYANVYSDLIDLKTSVQSYVISSDYTTKLEDAASYYLQVENMVTVADIKELQETLATEMVNSNFVAFIKAITGFIKALMTLPMWFDANLCANIDNDSYAEIGGLPSTKDRSEGSQYSLKSEFEDVDLQKSEYYSNLLGKYSNNTAAAGSVTTGEDVISTLFDNIEVIMQCVTDGNWAWYNVFSNLAKIMSAAANIFKAFKSFFQGIMETVKQAISQKLLLAGYVAYNVPNRTTYLGKALTGASYSLPDCRREVQGYAFNGCEAEYIMHGSMSETENQICIFTYVLLLRLVCNAPFVIANKEVATLAGEAAIVSLGIALPVVYGLYIIAESFVDTMILVNAGTVPMIKTRIYLTPSGVPDLISAFYKLALNEEQKNEMYKKAIDVATKGNGSDQFAGNYTEQIDANKNKLDKNKYVKSMTFDYTKSIMLLMILFTGTDTMLNRLADVVQMEGTYNAKHQIDSYTFDLDQSYTYLRASGKFETNEFIKISDADGIYSKERIVYRGY